MDTYQANMLVGSGHKECRKSQRVCRVLFLGIHQVLSCRTGHLNLELWSIRNKRECTWDVKLSLCILSDRTFKTHQTSKFSFSFSLENHFCQYEKISVIQALNYSEMTSLFSLAAPRQRAQTMVCAKDCMPSFLWVSLPSSSSKLWEYGLPQSRAYVWQVQLGSWTSLLHNLPQQLPNTYPAQLEAGEGIGS